MNNRFSLQEGGAYWGKVDNCSLCPATKEQRDTLLKAMADAGYTFDFEKKELRKLKFRVGDIVKSKSQPMLDARKIISIGKDCYWCEDRGCIGFAWEDDCEIVEQKPAECNNSILKDKLLQLFQRFRWYCKDETPTNGDIIEYVDAHIQELIDTVQNKPWSEEDEAVINKAESWLDTLCDYLKDSSSECIPDIKDVINKLKSLRPQKWKPSEEQMDALRYVTNFDYGGYKAILVSLYNNLKKLKE